MPRPLTLLHLTDLHLCGDPAAHLHGWRVEAAFDAVLAAALARHPGYDALVLGGDLVDDCSEVGYRRLNTRLAGLGRPVLAIAGNHDDPARMRALLDAARVHDTLALGGWQLIGLDSHRPQDDAGELGDAALERLAKRLAGDDRPAVVFVHHPPWPLGSAWLDAIGMSDADALRKVLADHRHVRALFCGHVHQSAQCRLDRLRCWASPSTMRQFLPASDVFAVDTRTPGYRVIQLGADARVTTRVHRVPAARAACG